MIGRSSQLISRSRGILGIRAASSSAGEPIVSFPEIVSKFLISAAHAGAVAGLLFATHADAAQTPRTLSISVDEDSVGVTNATPGGTVVLIMCDRGSRNGRTHVRKHTVMLQDDDRDGALRFTPETKVALRSVWVAVDMSSAATAAGAHPNFPLVVTDIPLSRFRKDTEGAIAAVDHELRRLFLVLVRPGSGAWTLLARDGKTGDADGAENARLTLKFAEARAIEGKASAPKHLKPNDVLVAIDPSRLDVYLARMPN